MSGLALQQAPGICHLVGWGIYDLKVAPLFLPTSVSRKGAEGIERGAGSGEKVCVCVWGFSCVTFHHLWWVGYSSSMLNCFNVMVTTGKSTGNEGRVAPHSQAELINAVVAC